VHAEEELRSVNRAAPALEEKQTAKILRMLPRTAEAMRARLKTQNLGLKDPRSTIQGRNTLSGLFHGRVPMRPAALKPETRRGPISHSSRGDQSECVIAGCREHGRPCVEIGSGGAILVTPTFRLSLAA
jgi:hypothetical protein